MFVKILLPSFLILSLSVFSQKHFNIQDFGAVADGKTLNTQSIQKAIDSCSKSGGGTVYFPNGIFITGNLQLRSNIHLHFESGSVLKGSNRIEDYRLNGIVRGIFYGEDLTNVAITGEGEINGGAAPFFDSSKMHTYIDFDKKYVRQGQAFFDALKPEDGPIYFEKRPDMLLVIMHSENIKITGVKFVDAPGWTIRIGDCENVVVEGISIVNNPLVPNSDGIHITISRNVRIANCLVEAGDDALIVSGFGDEITIDNASYGTKKKTYRYGNRTGNAENVVVSNCILKSNSAGIRIGYGKGNIRNLIFSNIIISHSNRGILINARESGNIENVTFNNLQIETRHTGGTWWGRGEPIHISSMPIVKDSVNGNIRGIQFSNIRIQSETGTVVWASERGKVSDLTFDNVRLTIVAGKKTAAFGGNIDLRPTPDVSTNIFKRDLPAMLFHRIEHVQMSRIYAGFTSGMPAFYTHGIELEKCNDFSINGSQFTGSEPRYESVFLNQSKKINLNNYLSKVKKVE